MSRKLSIIARIVSVIKKLWLYLFGKKASSPAQGERFSTAKKEGSTADSVNTASFRPSSKNDAMGHRAAQQPSRQEEKSADNALTEELQEAAASIASEGIKEVVKQEMNRQAQAQGKEAAKENIDPKEGQKAGAGEQGKNKEGAEQEKHEAKRGEIAQKSQAATKNAPRRSPPRARRPKTPDLPTDLAELTVENDNQEVKRFSERVMEEVRNKGGIGRY